LRKSILVAGVAALAVGSASVAYAQAVDPTISATASFSPSKAGTKSKPVSESLSLKVVNNPASKTTAKSITIKFPSTLKLSTKGLDQCTASDDKLLENINVCKKSIAGSGSAHAVLNPNNPAPLTFKVVPVVGKNEMLFVLSGSAGAVLHGKIKGSTLTIAITPTLQQPVPHLLGAGRPLDEALQEEGQELPPELDGLQGQEADHRRHGRLRAEPDRAHEALRVDFRRRQVLVVLIRT